MSRGRAVRLGVAGLLAAVATVPAVNALASGSSNTHATAARAAAATSWTVGTSPLTAQVSLTGNGALRFAVASKGASIIPASPMGLATDAADFTRGLTFTSRTDRTVVESYTMTTGKQRKRDETYSEATLSFTASNGKQLRVVVRAGREGVAYRYVLPGSGTTRVERETSAWTVPTGSTAWLNDSALDYQGQWRQTTAGGAAGRSYAYPALFKVGNTYVSLAESGIDGGYTASLLDHDTGSGTYSTSLESQVTAGGTVTTAWRIAVVGDLATVTSNRVVDDLATPSEIADTSWVKPGKVAWSWPVDGTGDAALQRRYVDFVQKHGWPYILFDEGWKASEIPGLVSYAKARGVGVILWYNSDKLQTATQRQALDQAKNWGVAGVKIDYVFEHDQKTLRWFDTVLAQTAALKLMVNFHGTEMTRGMQRTWPHVMTSEAVYGGEQKHLRAVFNTILPFTRNTVSSMDFTPVLFSVKDRDTTDGHELATAGVFESGWQHLADSTRSYEAQPVALSVLDKLPTAWDETKLLGGTPGREAYLARRAGDTWVVAGISAVAAKTFSTEMSFLGSGQWFVEAVRDGGDGQALVRKTASVTSTSTLSVPVATRGGFLALVCPATPGITACPRPAAVR